MIYAEELQSMCQEHNTAVMNECIFFYSKELEG
jgi:hypothetical protein